MPALDPKQTFTVVLDVNSPHSCFPAEKWCFLKIARFAKEGMGTRRERKFGPDSSCPNLPKLSRHKAVDGR